ncbi:DUF2179 domain-containing protein [Methanoplanus endosymbiosus]|uniref:UPF0316 protein L6E24_06420 n=1 Tax=Methanoplanus endosymbiosus TaxID=33865 RepID=A0A9E7PPN1_9EURY|nr:DUF2179 domain-containing protein [Methanoplanus endosymbiosus]UUX93745.1 DUF2179 domain-containing protein [Methanoplanus endosymbiosus]
MLIRGGSGFLVTIDPEIVSFLILPALIFFARIADVTCGTLRIIFISRGMRLFSAVLGFFEISIWLLAISEVFSQGLSPAAFLAYALGFAAGNYVGITVEEKMALGISVVRVITQYNAEELIFQLKESGFRTTSVNAMGQFGPVSIIYSVVKRKDISEALRQVHKYNPNAFYTIEDIRHAGGPMFSPDGITPKRGVARYTRKAK